MSHISEDILRRYVDEPGAMLSYEKEHLLQCSACRAALESIRAKAEFAAANLRAGENVDLDAARRSILARAAHAGQPAVSQSRYEWHARSMQWTFALAAAFALFLVLGYEPLRGAATNFLAIFEPRQFTPIGFTSSDTAKLRALPNLKAFGTMHQSGSDRIRLFTDRAAVSAFAHMNVLKPKYLPAGVPNAVRYHATAAHSASFQFKPTKAHPMGAPIAGSMLNATFSPIVIQTYGEKASAQNWNKKRGWHKHEEGLSNMPADTIVVTQAAAPRVFSSGATVAEIESWLIAQPGVPAGVVEQIKSIGDPSTTVPVPVQLDKQLAQKVTVQGSAGLMIGDNTGVGSVVMWEKSGIVYAVAGPYAASEILQVANSLGE
ncbi:MAG: hypothetical protein M3126_00575 [Candidatus Eremiobacteraeota bacterium]|nr:hypothetical protein [Candidatus Eremiobacteraeota bacterium]